MNSNLVSSPIQICELQTPVGLLTIAATDQGVTSILFSDETNASACNLKTSNLIASSAKTQSPKLAVLKVLAPASHQTSTQQSAVSTTSSNFFNSLSNNPGATAQAHLQQATEQLQQYFAGDRQQFSLTLAPVGSPFQQQVWQALCAIPFAHSCSYGAIANHLQHPKAVRAVGAANGRNPIAIVVPCHRVIGANGSLTGYAGGLNRKLWLLQHEMQFAGV